MVSPTYTTPTVIVQQQQNPPSSGGPQPGMGAGFKALEQRLDKFEQNVTQRLNKTDKAIDILADAVLQLQKEKGKGPGKGGFGPPGSGFGPGGKFKGKGKRDDDDVRASGSAKITVHLPAESRLYVDGVLCPMSSATRSFDTPVLPGGQKFFYTLRVVDENGGRAQSKQVFVQAGQHVEVNFETSAFTSKN